jgi:transcriptional regulator with XRE-family HTH domain
VNALLGARIRRLRESKKMTQQQVAEHMNCSRQRVARLEKGLVDVSYAAILDIAGVLNVDAAAITGALAPQPLFRANGHGQADEGFAQIEQILDVFFAHRRLYQRVVMEHDDE